MKKYLVLLLAVIMVFALTACGGGSEEPADTSEASETNTAEEEVATEEEVTYGVGDTWTVDGQWNFTVDSVEATDERNEFDESNPEQVIYIKYHYENLGYEDEMGVMDGLYLYPDSLIDSDGNMCQEYPINPEELYAQETPVGAKCTGGVAFGLVKEGSPVKMILTEYDGNGDEQKATFVLEF